ncbi:MAG: FMN-binding negative transcriptional regulator, partial [Cellulomonas sp.]|nr:FMN-binding negative transcriptional regulator [Cellulomonas sp.]
MIETPHYAVHDEQWVRALVHDEGWATLITLGDEGLIASHVPVLLDESADHLVVLGHLGRPDDRAHGLDGVRES